MRLEELLDANLQRRQARDTGICPIRRELYTQCFGKHNALYLTYNGGRYYG